MHPKGTGLFHKKAAAGEGATGGAETGTQGRRHRLEQREHLRETLRPGKKRGRFGVRRDSLGARRRGVRAFWPFLVFFGSKKTIKPIKG